MFRRIFVYFLVVCIHATSSSTLQAEDADEAQEELGEIQESAIEKRRAMDQTDPAVERLIDLGYLELQEGDSRRAMKMFAKAARKDPKNRRARSGLGTALIRQERFFDAEQVLVPLLEDYPDDFFLKNNLAWLYATAKDHRVKNGPKAIRLAQEALLVAPWDYHVWSTLSEAYYVSAHYEKAVRAAEEALRLSRAQVAKREDLVEYSTQLEKCKKALHALSVVE